MAIERNGIALKITHVLATSRPNSTTRSSSQFGTPSPARPLRQRSLVRLRAHDPHPPPRYRHRHDPRKHRGGILRPRAIRLFLASSRVSRSSRSPIVSASPVSRSSTPSATRGRRSLPSTRPTSRSLETGLFLKVACDMAKNEYPEIEFESMIVDNASMQLVSRPQQFDVMLMPNLYGNIISNIACGLVGGPGLVSGINVGDDYAVFETGTRNTGTSLAGTDKANPTAFIRAGVDMLRYLNYNSHANLISDALFKAITESRLHTPDVGGDARASELVQAVIKNIDEELKNSPLL
ncbi:hypothetical protein L596_005397 [Steinernema carpocapsae]|uniref:Isopropylmalate dehydrogenase-like domain-containing protein n=1 Tax=Steinernema carpocapsae TaxID=34508 RepID=A0A4V6I8G0_STECR|nr:hypothetical protein L596_005397 [Steinernema carpocapsae]